MRALGYMHYKLSFSFRYLCAFTCILICFAATQGQSTKQRAAALQKAKTLFVSDIETGMPHQKLEKWFRGQVWNKPRIKWKAVNCEASHDLPAAICVELSANSFDMFVGITLERSKYQNGIRESKFVLRRITISREDQGLFEVGKLSELSAKLDAVLAM